MEGDDMEQRKWLVITVGDQQLELEGCDLKQERGWRCITEALLFPTTLTPGRSCIAVHKWFASAAGCLSSILSHGSDTEIGIVTTQLFNTK